MWRNKNKIGNLKKITSGKEFQQTVVFLTCSLLRIARRINQLRLRSLGGSSRGLSLNNNDFSLDVEVGPRELDILRSS